MFKYKNIQLNPIDMEILQMAIEIVDERYEMEYEVQCATRESNLDKQRAEIALMLLSRIMYELNGVDHYAEKQGIERPKFLTPWLEEKPPQMPSF